MEKVKVITPFDWWHLGYERHHYPAGEQHLPADAAAVALAEGWAEKAHAAAPENKDAAPLRTTKAPRPRKEKPE